MSRVALTSFTLAVVLTASAARAGEVATCATAAEDAQRLRDESKLSEAKDKLLMCSKSDCPKVVRTDCIGWLEEVTRSMPSLVVRAKDERGADADGKLYVDDKLAAPRLDGSAIDLDPGRHQVRVELADGTRLEQEVTVATGEKNRLVTLAAKSKAAVAKKTTAAPDASSSSVAPWILGGIGAAGLVTFGVLELVAQGEYSDMKDGCGATRSCTDGELSPIRTKFVAAGVALGVGVVALGSGITWKLLESDQTKDRASLQLAPTSGGAFLRASGSF